MHKSYHLSDGQTKVLISAEGLEHEAHKLRARSGLPPVAANPHYFAATTYEVFSTALWALNQYWRIAKVRGARGDWGQYFVFLLNVIPAEWNIFLKGCAVILRALADSIQGKDLSDIRAEIEAMREGIAI